MISRQEKNKKIEKAIKKEKTLNFSKKIFKLIIYIFILFTIIFIYMYRFEPKMLTTKEYIIKNDNIPQTFYGTKILHFSDLLYGKTIFTSDLEKIQKEITLINPNIVIFTGNIISNDYILTEKDITSLNNFFKNIPYNIGKYTVRGNNDNTKFDLIMDDTNFKILDNVEEIIYYKDVNPIRIIGLNENYEDIKLTNNDLFTITIINNYDHYPKDKIPSNIVLAGNNLGGEINLFSLPLLGNNQYMKSFYHDNNCDIYISSGLGTNHHLRLMNLPSLNVYRLYN